MFPYFPWIIGFPMVDSMGKYAIQVTGPLGTTADASID